MDMNYHFDIRETRKDLGLTQKQAAEICELSHRRYCDYELGGKNLRRWEYLGVKAALVEGAYNAHSGEKI